MYLLYSHIDLAGHLINLVRLLSLQLTFVDNNQTILSILKYNSIPTVVLAGEVVVVS